MSTNPYDSPASDPSVPVAAQPTMPPGTFRDQSTGLVLFGVLQLLLGGACGLMTLVTAATLAMPGPGQAPGVNLRMMVPGMAMYVLLGLGFVVLGIGSIRARRWAWTLTVVLSWLWLALGVVACGSGVLVVSSMFASMQRQGGVRPEFLLVTLLIAGAFAAVIYIGLPGVFLLFYQRASVRATCEARDPRIPWTDRCPKPVLALSLLLAFWSVMSLVSTVTSLGVFPMFGVLLSGLPGAAALLFVALVTACLAWGTYRMKPAAWWGTLLLYVAVPLSSWLTFSQVNPLDMYTKMGFSADQLNILRGSGAFASWSSMGTWGSLLIGVVGVGYLLCVRSCFDDKGEAS
jgi:hypothetical protein